MKKGILTPQKHWGPSLAPKGGIFKVKKNEMSSKQLGEMVEGNSADTCAGKFLLMSMGG